MPLLSLIIFLVTLTPPTHSKEVLKTYSVKKITRAIQLSGKGDDPLWKKADVLSDFSYPWENEKPLPTKFRALHNDQWLYCLFEVTDTDINIRQSTHHKSEVASSSRAEIFFKIDDRLAPYYCLEIDPLGRVFDYEAHYYRKFDLNWIWPRKHILVKTEQTGDGYTIELALSKASLKELGLLKDNRLQAGVYRADCSFNSSGDPDFKWVSWVKPESKTPDFHIPSSFGIFTLED
jgi:hypothetical protein